MTVEFTETENVSCRIDLNKNEFCIRGPGRIIRGRLTEKLKQIALGFQESIKNDFIVRSAVGENDNDDLRRFLVAAEKAGTASPGVEDIHHRAIGLTGEI